MAADHPLKKLPATNCKPPALHRVSDRHDWNQRAAHSYLVASYALSSALSLLSLVVELLHLAMKSTT